MGRLVILDRDGVINHDSVHYVKSVDEWVPIPGALEAIAELKQSGWTVAVATNQSGVARGLLSEDTLAEIHQTLRRQLAALDASVDCIVWCPHGPEEGCDCRKPRPGLYQQIGQRFQCSLTGVPVIGDSLRDLQAAVAVGARPMLVTTGKGRDTYETGGLPAGTEVFPDLVAAARGLMF
ncbi:D-glycero-beta-D-manno-heptose 1,7-bisphosphate 7-phosphatase [Spiribacter sp. 2438]|uniref:D-glycero-beta-D-manno-heptose 1,7-bisphosphate 7-phosphatase n=1 Tax=Spiribacter sp. 2438 TaxID=2666185 RepID=UPI0012AF8BC6|nr:D-glycero-beta-D-manno-heptose 1,7-bisphosphate 7-phosphatase [Spiribacter sp. 2438]QGM22366.1 D-glycero-beta-D-manno-heptose 1,7-bisphosphate 7-phosphatase [Spiribacter sp. 2438]